jgi:D-alanyl-D-alanine carboxypeptidase/D-alanyl-D-alanine-endopeptidase (penicillin-binding protein 4)
MLRRAMKHLRLAVLAPFLAGVVAVGCAEREPSVRRDETRPGSALADRVQAAVKKLDDKISDLGGTDTIAFVDVTSGEMLGAAHEHDAKNPASNAKLATTAAALSILGPEHRFTTALYGSLQGTTVPTLVLRGRGDPTLDMDDLSHMVRELRAAGVKKVGKIAVDQSYFDDQYVPPAFEQQPNEWAYFRAPVAAVSVNENTVTIWLHPTKKGDPCDVRVNPPGFVDVTGSVTTEKKGSEEKISCDMSVSGDKNRAALDGNIPEDALLVPVVKRVDDPRRFAGFALRAVLKEQGIDPGEKVELGGSEYKIALATHTSRPLGEIVALMGKESDNFVAEMVMRATGEAKGGSTSAAEGAKAVSDFLDAEGALDPGTKITNGSGLFDANRFTAAGVTKLLSTVYGDPRIGSEFLAQLSIGGLDGTLKHRFKDWGDKRVIRGKTGTLAATNAISGYILAPKGGSPIAFSILVNEVKGKGTEVRKAMDECVESVASELWPKP